MTYNEKIEKERLERQTWGFIGYTPRFCEKILEENLEKSTLGEKTNGYYHMKKRWKILATINL